MRGSLPLSYDRIDRLLGFVLPISHYKYMCLPLVHDVYGYADESSNSDTARRLLCSALSRVCVREVETPLSKMPGSNAKI